MGLRQHPELPSPGRSDGESLPFSSNYLVPLLTFNCQPLPEPWVLTGPGTSDCSCHPGPHGARGLALLYGSSSSAASIRRTTVSTPRTIPSLLSKIFSGSRRFSVPGARCTQTAHWGGWHAQGWNRAVSADPPASGAGVDAQGALVDLELEV